MIYRVDYLPENKINPITGQEYDSSWIVFTLTCSVDNRAITGMGKEGVYFIRVSRFLNDDWQLSVGDFIGYCDANALNGILVMSESDYNDALGKYDGHSYNEPVLRKDEAPVLIHSTTADCWKSIQHDGALKSWNQLKRDLAEWESKPIGAQLGDLSEFSDYIMFGGGVSGEIVVSSKLSGFINMDVNAEYHTGARLYFDAKKMAEDGMLVRDGAHVKVKDSLPLEPYLMWVATWDKLGLNSPLSTPKIFAETADDRFRVVYHYDLLIDENNDPVHDPKPLQEYMNKWDGPAFIEQMQLNNNISVLEIGVGTGRLAVRVAPLCGAFYGVDISSKTIERAAENLTGFENVSLTCADFLTYGFDRTYDVVYSSLTFMHIEDKQRAVNRIAELMNPAGRFVLSIDKNPSEFIDTGIRKVKIYPDTAEIITECIKNAGLSLLKQFDTEFATIFVAQKDR